MGKYDDFAALTELEKRNDKCLGGKLVAFIIRVTHKVYSFPSVFVCVCVCMCVLFIVLIGVISSEQPTAASESHAAMQHVNQQQASWLSPKYTPSWASVYVSAYLCEVRVSLRFLIKIENCLFVHMCVEDN